MTSSAAEHDTQMTIMQFDNIITKLFQKIPKTWPLKEAIAVNPWDESTQKPMQDVLAYWQTFSAANTTPKQSYLYKEFRHLALNDDSHRFIYEKYDVTAEDLKSSLAQEATSFKVKSAIEYLDDAINKRLNQAVFDFCGQYSQENKQSLLNTWLQQHQQLIEPLNKQLNLSIESRDSKQLLIALLHFLDINPSMSEDFLFHVMSQLIGWCSYFKYHYLDAHRQLADLLCIRLLLEVLEINKLKLNLEFWHKHLEQAKSFSQLNLKQSNINLALMELLEHKEQQKVATLLTHKHNPAAQSTIMAQAIFCIDPRSERIRRHIEQVSDSVETIGVAGFFSLPFKVKDNDHGDDIASHPGILNTTTQVLFDEHSQIAKQNAQGFFHEITQHPFLQFKLVELTGIGESYYQLKHLFKHKRLKTLEGEQISYQLTDTADGTLTLNDKVAICEGFIKSTSVSQFADTVYIFGHQSDGINNAELSQLQCGACGGQSGLINALVMCDLLNDKTIRQMLSTKNIKLSDSTTFIAGVHETVTDELMIFGGKSQPVSEDILDCFKTASSQARLEKENGLPSNQTFDSPLARAAERTQDISFVRTEWGLAKHKAFIIAPRSLTTNINFEGTCFLHDYNHYLDDDDTILASILAGPVNVASWINLQYYASTVDNTLFGSGDKLIHQAMLNGHAVLEGASGDLRFGLSQQSVYHNGDYFHQPLRLSVIISAPKTLIENALTQCPSVKQLAQNGWLHLLQFDERNHELSSWSNDNWRLLS